MFPYPYPQMGPPIQPPPMFGSLGMAAPSRAVAAAPPMSSLVSRAPSAMSNILPSIQKFAGVAQTVTPMVRQYYPLVKQLPALWRMLSAYRSVNQTPLPAANDTSSASHDTLETDWSPVEEETYSPVFHPGMAYYSEAPPPKLYI